MEKEEYLKQKKEGALDTEFMYEYYKAHKKPEWRLLPIEEFAALFSDFMKLPVVVGTQRTLKKVDKKSIFKKVCKYFDKQFDI